MYYEINVAKRRDKAVYGGSEYTHFFATAPRSCTTEGITKDVVKIFKEKFPEPEYKIDVTMWQNLGTGISVEKLLEDKE